MKKVLFAVVISLVTLPGSAQQRPHYTQYILNNYILNPALSGIENYIDVKISGRNQWLGLEGAPRTAYLSVHGPIGKKDYKTTATSFHVPGENPRGTNYWENYTASAAHHGVGFTMINDQTGLYNRFSAAATYAYHIGLSPRANLALGFSGGVINYCFNAAKAQAANPNDPVLTGGGNLNQLRPDLGAGIWFYAADYFVGVSAQQLLPQTVSFVDDPRYGFRLIPHFFATAGYRFLVSDDVNVIPSLLFKRVAASPTHPQFDVNVKLQYQDVFWLGGSYRWEDGYAAMAGLNVGNAFNVGYSYDITRTALNTVSRGTHELIIGFLLGNNYGDTCPRNIW